MKYKLLFVILILLTVYRLINSQSIQLICKVKNKIRRTSGNILTEIDIDLPSDTLVQKILHEISLKGSKLVKSRNLNKSSGSKLNYFQIEQYIPEFIEFIEKHNYIEKVQNVVNKNITLLENDRYKYFLKLYSDNDFIDWHYDNNFSRGIRYTLIVPLYIDNCNTSELMIIDPNDCNIKKITIQQGKGVIFDGSKIAHRVSKQTLHCKRLSLIMPLYENPKLTFVGQVLSNIRDVGFDVFKL